MNKILTALRKIAAITNIVDEEEKIKDEQKNYADFLAREQYLKEIENTDSHQKVLDGLKDVINWQKTSDVTVPTSQPKSPVIPPRFNPFASKQGGKQKTLSMKSPITNSLQIAEKIVKPEVGSKIISRNAKNVLNKLENQKSEITQQA